MERDLEELKEKVDLSLKTATEELNSANTAVSKFRERMEEELVSFKRQKVEMEQKRVEWGSVVDLNVGGTKYSTSLSTLTAVKSSMLAAMFSGRHELARDKKGNVFIDRDGSLFK